MGVSKNLKIKYALNIEKMSVQGTTKYEFRSPNLGKIFQTKIG